MPWFLKSKPVFASVITALLCLLTACGGGGSENSKVGSDEQQLTGSSLLNEAPQFSVLREVLYETDTQNLSFYTGGKSFTFFAPNNDAFVELLGKLDITKQELLTRTQFLTNFLAYHFVYPDNEKTGNFERSHFNSTSKTADTRNTASEFATQVVLSSSLDKSIREEQNKLCNEDDKDDQETCEEEKRQIKESNKDVNYDYFVNNAYISSSTVLVNDETDLYEFNNLQHSYNRYSFNNDYIYEISRPLFDINAFVTQNTSTTIEYIEQLDADGTGERYAILLEAIRITSGLESHKDVDARLRLLQEPHSIFIPSDEAFREFFEASSIDESTFLTSPELASRILLLHMMSGSNTSLDLYKYNGDETPMLARRIVESRTGDSDALEDDEDPFMKFPLIIKEGGIYISERQIKTLDIVTADGVIHTVERIFMDPTDPFLNDY